MIDAHDTMIDAHAPGRRMVTYYLATPDAMEDNPTCPACGAVPYVHTGAPVLSAREIAEGQRLWPAPKWVACRRCGYSSDPDDTYAKAWRNWRGEVREYRLSHPPAAAAADIDDLPDDGA